MSDVQHAAAAVLAGELIVLPTDTVYGLGTRPDRPEATARVFAAKRRGRDLELPVLVPSREAAERIAEFDARARGLAEELWPGALTLVLRRTHRSRSWDLGEDAGSVGVRMPDHPVALAVLALSGPLAVSSANRSAEPTPSTCSGVREVFEDEISVYLCDDERIGGRASTVVDLTPSEPLVLRAGGLEARVLDLLSSDSRLHKGRC